MKEKTFILMILTAAIICGVCYAQTPDAIWDMSGSTVNKIISVPTNEPNYPAGSIMMEREVLEDSDGDIVFGIWREDNEDFLQNPDLVDGALTFYGNQIAYIEDIMDNVMDFKISFDFKPDVIDKDMTILEVTGAWQIRTEPGADANAGTTRLRAYANTYVPAAGKFDWRSQSSDWTVTADQWHNVEMWVQDGVFHLAMDGVEMTPAGANLETGLSPSTYPNLFIGARWDGTQRQFEGAVDNIELTYYDETCGAWGYSDLDFNYDCYVNLADYAYFADTWLDCTDPAVQDCSPVQ